MNRLLEDNWPGALLIDPVQMFEGLKLEVNKLDAADPITHYWAIRLLLVAIVLVALALRIWGIAYDSPDIYHTILALSAFLFILAASLLGRLYELVPKLDSRTLRVVAVIALSLTTLTSLTIPAIATIQDNIQLGTTSSRETAGMWIEENLPRGATVAIEAYAPFEDPARFSLTSRVNHPLSGHCPFGLRLLRLQALAPTPRNSNSGNRLATVLRLHFEYTTDQVRSQCPVRSQRISRI